MFPPEGHIFTAWLNKARDKIAIVDGDLGETLKTEYLITFNLAVNNVYISSIDLFDHFANLSSRVSHPGRVFHHTNKTLKIGITYM